MKDLINVKIPFESSDIKKYKTSIIVYAVYNIETHKFYIGSTKSPISRKNRHFSQLKRNIHHSQKLQASYNKYGLHAFVFLIIEVVNFSNQIEREQYYIDLYNAVDNGYNHERIAGNFSGICPQKRYTAQQKISKEFSVFDTNGKVFNGRNISDFCRENGLSAASFYSMLNGKVVSANGWNICPEEYRDFEYVPIEYLNKVKEKYRTLLINKNCHSEYSFVKDGVVINIKNLKHFCRENDLSSTILYNTYHGKSDKPYLGYVSNKNEEIKQKQLNYKPVFHILLTQTGQIIKIDSIKDYCKEKGLSDWFIYQKENPNHFRNGICVAVRMAHRYSSEELNKKIKEARYTLLTFPIIQETKARG